MTIRRQDTARCGDVVAAPRDGGATVKHLRIVGGRTWLIPRHPAYDPVPAGQATIPGTVVSLLRRPWSGPGRAGSPDEGGRVRGSTALQRCAWRW
ncbi:hypothetical protein GCM10018781_72560 [Kitasatospora indigofera]|uniref:Peptidase S24/S26A/S26B/S26C domain-containing protein n=1 Tax=Kitasatospora indigofera TaxID=67307 RepID=A0A919GFJ4_9ACTN|nr:S24 family peptidase [Kitasatospora indigofera]GHH84037.1 hypothetical protein GCM10018781_72560 [Kitasatospora indigofera]